MPADPQQPARVEEAPRIGLDVLTRLVGVETVVATRVAHDVRAWVSDTGIDDGLAVNMRVTVLREVAAIAAGHRHHPSPYGLHGDAVLVGLPDAGGDETSVPGWVVELLTLGRCA